MQKVCVIGCGRGIIHAQAYKTMADIVGVCDLDANKVSDAVNKIMPTPRGYNDVATMMSECQPDILHVVTSPIIPRYKWLSLIQESPSVKVSIMEKPLALTPEEFEKYLSKYDQTKPIIINHQRRYFKAFMLLKRLLEEKAFGEIMNVTVTSYGEITEMMTHLLDIILMCHPAMPDDIIAKAWGKQNIYNPVYLCPDNIMATLIYDDFPMINVMCGTDTMFHDSTKGMSLKRLNDSYRYHYTNRMRVVVTGRNGVFWWHEYGDWGYRGQDRVHTGLSDYVIDSELAQELLSLDNVRLAMGEIAKTEHLCNGDNAIQGIKLLLAIYNACNHKSNLGNCLPIDQDGYLTMIHNIGE